MVNNKKFSTEKNLKESYGDLSIDELKKVSIFLSRLFKKNLNIQLKKSFSVDFFDWLYNKNPNGKAITYNIYDEDRVVAHFALVPITVNYKNKLCKSALTVFTAIDKAYRGLSIFHHIGSKTLDLAKSMKFEFIIGVANNSSAQLFEKCFEFKIVCPLQIKLCFNGFYQMENVFHNFNVFWNEESLLWRLNNPRFEYQIFTKKKELKIYNDVYKLFKIDMGNFLKEDYNFLLNYKNKINFKISPLDIWVGLNSSTPSNLFSINCPKFLRPSDLNFIIKNLNSDDMQIKKEDIKFNLIDFEVY